MYKEKVRISTNVFHRWGSGQLGVSKEITQHDKFNKRVCLTMLQTMDFKKYNGDTCHSPWCFFMKFTM